MRGISSTIAAYDNTLLVLAIVLLVVAVEYWSFKLQSVMQKDRQREIDRLVEDNRRYRDFFEKMLLQSHFGNARGRAGNDTGDPK